MSKSRFILNRRELIASTGAAALIGLSGTRLRADTPRRGGDLVIAAPGASTGNSLDPRSFNSPYMAVLSGTVFNTLVETVGAPGEIQPGLAHSWEQSEGARVWRFNLVENATFHNGQRVTSADVIYSYMSHVAEGSRSNSRSIISSIETMEADGDYAVVIRLNEPNFFFPAMLTSYSLVIVPDGTTEYTGIGSGPYQITNFVPGEICETRRFDGYFKEDAAYVDTVTLLGVNDANARVSALQTGQAHISTLLDHRSVSLLESLPNVSINYLPTRIYEAFNMMVDREPFNNLKLRQAMKFAINRQDIIERIYYGHARLGNDTPVPPSAPDFATDVPQYEYDPDRARDLLAESGHTGPVVLRTSDAAGGGAVDMATLFREHASAAGIDIEVQREPADGYWANVWAQTPFHAVIWGSRPTTDMIMTLAYSSGSPANDTAFADPEFDAALARARGSDSAEERLVAGALAQRILNERGGAIIPAFGDTAEGASNALGGYNAQGDLVGGLRAAENVWFM